MEYKREGRLHTATCFLCGWFAAALDPELLRRVVLIHNRIRHPNLVHLNQAVA